MLVNSATCDSNVKWNNAKCSCGCKDYSISKKDDRWNTGTCICESRRYSKSIADDSVVV